MHTQREALHKTWRVPTNTLTRSAEDASAPRSGASFCEMSARWYALMRSTRACFVASSTAVEPCTPQAAPLATPRGGVGLSLRTSIATPCGLGRHFALQQKQEHDAR